METIADSGLRLVNLILANEEWITKLAIFLHTRNQDRSLEQIKRELEWLSFIWAMTNVEDIVSAINVREIRKAVNAVVERGNSPAHDLIGYFSQLEAATELSGKERSELAKMLKKHDDAFVQRVLSIRTQHYMNTHRSSAQIEQSVCSILNIRYKPRMLGID